MAEEDVEPTEMGTSLFIPPGAGIIMSKVERILETSATEWWSWRNTACTVNISL